VMAIIIAAIGSYMVIRRKVRGCIHKH
jgi:hypothetical protein